LYSYAGNDPLANIDPFGTKGNKYACFFTEHQFSLAVTVAGFMLDYSPVGWGLHALDVGMIAYHHFYC
jgi:hypothetical protein